MGRPPEGLKILPGSGAAPRRFVSLIDTLRTNGRARPAELAVSLLFSSLLALSFAVRWSGHPCAAESLRGALFYTVGWFLWMAVAAFVIPASWRRIQSLRDLGPWIAVMQAYNLIRYLIPAVHPAQFDGSLRRIEAGWGFGSGRWAHVLMGHPRWTDLFCAVYLALFVWMMLYACWYAFVRRAQQQAFMLGFIVIYAGGFLGYMLVPAIGPRYAFAGEWSWLSGGAVFALCNRTVAGMGARFDAWPSLHVALSTYLFSWQVRHHRWNLLWGLPLTAGIWISTIWLGFHYLPDLPPGAFLALAAIAAGARIEPRVRALPPTRRTLSGRIRTRNASKNPRLRPAEVFDRAFFDFSSTVTTFFPRVGARFFDGVVLPVFASRPLIGIARRKNRRIVARIRGHDRILVVCDTHIGDAIYTQAAVSALREFFPDAHIDYAVHHAVAPLIEGNPEINRVLPVFTGTLLPSGPDLHSVGMLLKRDGYDFYLNFSPFFVGAGVYRTARPVLDIHTHAHEMARNEIEGNLPNHFLYQMPRFVRSVLGERFPARRAPGPHRVRIYLREAARSGAESWLRSTGWRPPTPLVFLNPDAASPFTQIPEEMQADLLERIGRQGAFLLIGEGITNGGSGRRLQESLPASCAESSAVVPARLPLDVYASLIDFSDVFISGDTGPLHIAAARKQTKDGPERFANRTAVFSIFGATPARISGYDHRRKGYLPADQDAASTTFISESPCRNITCVNKLLKTCARPRCFHSLDTEAIALGVREVLSGERRNSMGMAGSSADDLR